MIGTNAMFQTRFFGLVFDFFLVIEGFFGFGFVSDFDIRISDFDVMASVRDKAELFPLAMLLKQT
jgi:hypothetical protein